LLEKYRVKGRGQFLLTHCQQTFTATAMNPAIEQFGSMPVQDQIDSLPQDTFRAANSDCGIGSSAISFRTSNPALRHMHSYSAAV
jgi:hypothetical protein